MFFVLKCIKMMFFYFLKIIFEISTSKRFKIYKKKLIFNKTKLNFGGTRIAPRSNRSLYYENEIITIKDSNMHRDNNLRNHYIKMNNFWL